MSKKKKDNPGAFVLKADCTEMMRHGDEQFKEIKNALVGNKFGEIGGVVKDIADIKTKLSGILTEKEEHKKSRLRWRMAAISLAFMLVGFLFEAVINHFWH